MPPPVRNPILWYQLAAAFLISAVFIACKPHADLWPTVANLHGTILKAYPGKVGGKPLKDLFRK